MRILFVNSIPETFSNPTYSRHFVLQKLFREIGEVVLLNLYQGKTSTTATVLSLFNIKKRIKKAFASTKIETFDVVVLTTISYPGMKYIKRVCQKIGIVLIIDCVEWASPEEKRFGKFSLSYVHNTRINEHLIDTKVRTISISSYFSKYFEKKNIQTEVIPNLVDVKEIKILGKEKHEKVELLFAGYPNKKDAIDIAVGGMMLLDKEKISCFNLTIAGISKEDFFNKFKRFRKNEKEIDRCVKFLGKVSSERVAELYKNADFSVLIRNDGLRVCNAGFPTKLLDSYKYSTPIIANLTSDIGKYLQDGRNGFVVNQFSAESFSSVLSKIYEEKIANKLNLNELSRNSFDTCVYYFDYTKYVDKVNRLTKPNK